MLTIAYIGNGKSTNRYHLPFSRQIENIKAKTIYDRSGSSWERVEGIEYTSNIDDILKDPEIELVVIATPVGSHYDVRQLLGKDRINDYFDLDFYYGNMKLSIKSSYFRIKPRPSFVVYGKKGMFVKQTTDRQEADLKKFYMPTNEDFGMDSPQHYGTLTYIDNEGKYHQEKVVSKRGDYSRFYQTLYDSLINGKEKLVKDEETIRQIEILEEGIRQMK